MATNTNSNSRYIQNGVLHSYPESSIRVHSFFSTDSEGSTNTPGITPSASLNDLVGPQGQGQGEGVTKSGYRPGSLGTANEREEEGQENIQEFIDEDDQVSNSSGPEYLHGNGNKLVNTSNHSQQNQQRHLREDSLTTSEEGIAYSVDQYQSQSYSQPQSHSQQYHEHSSPQLHHNSQSPSQRSHSQIHTDEYDRSEEGQEEGFDMQQGTHQRHHPLDALRAAPNPNPNPNSHQNHNNHPNNLDRNSDEADTLENPHHIDYSGGQEYMEDAEMDDGGEFDNGQGQGQGHGQGQEDELGSDASSIISIPDPEIDFTLTYALHTFIATVEGQASVIKGDSLLLLDDANSYWWLVRVLKTDDVGYIPAENIETPYERLARLNKHRNVDLATATEEENEAAALREQQARGSTPNGLNARIQLPSGESPSSSDTSGEFISSSVDQHGRNQRRKSVVFAAQLTREHPGRIIEDSEDESQGSGDEIDGEAMGEGGSGTRQDGRAEDEDTSDEEDGKGGAGEIEHVEQVVRPGEANALAGGGAGTAAAVGRAAGQGHGSADRAANGRTDVDEMDPDDGMSWDEGMAQEELKRRADIRGDQQFQQHQADQKPQKGDLATRQPTPVQQQQGQRDLGIAGGLQGQQTGTQQQQQSQQQQQQQQAQTPPMQQTVSGPGRARSSSIGAANRAGQQALRPSVQIDTNVAGSRTAGQAGSGLGATASGGMKASESQSNLLDPMDALDAEPRRITATPMVAQGNELDRIMGLQAKSNRLVDQRAAAPTSRNVSAASEKSFVSAVSSVSGRSSISPDSPTDEFGSKKSKKDKNGKQKRSTTESETDDGSIRKKKSGVFGGLFKKKEKKGSGAGIEGGQPSGGLPRSNSFGNDSDSFGGRASDDESMVSGPRDSPDRMTSTNGGKPGLGSRNPYTSPASMISASTASPTIVSPHGLRLQQIDQQQQALYQQYMARSPTSVPEDASRAYGTQAAATVAQSSAAQRLAHATSSAGGRPGSIMLSPNPLGPAGPVLNVMRIFAGQDVDAEHSFKTVLLSPNTGAQDLVKQAVQRFGLKGTKPVQSIWEDYFLTVKGAEGEEYALEEDMKPLEALNEMVKRSGEEDADYQHQIRRSSIGSISSVNSNLSLHPAISSKLNDFSDDSVVKLYLHRKNGDLSSTFGSYGSQLTTDGTITQSISNATSVIDGGVTSEGEMTDTNRNRGAKPSPITISSYNANTQERASPSARFTMQIFISARDLPDNMCFDPQSDKAVYKTTMRNRNSLVPGTSMDSGFKRRLFFMPKNVTAGEAVEQGLERFGIMDGVVDGGDDIEDRVGKRRSVVKVRYGLEVRRALDNEDGSGIMKASHNLLDAYETPPKFRLNDKVPAESRRRSREWSQSSGTDGDLQPTDPVFILRRMKNRLSGGDVIPLDDVALHKQKVQEEVEKTASETRSKQEMIAAQRATSRANQQALLSAHANTSQGIDVVVPQNGTLRSSRVQVDGAEQMRYSYIDGEGGTHDVSSLVENELGAVDSVVGQRDLLSVPGNLRRMDTDQSAYVTAPSTPMEMVDGKDSAGRTRSRLSTTSTSDLLQDIMDSGNASDASERVQAVLSKVKNVVSGGPQSHPDITIDESRSTIRPPGSISSSTSPGGSSLRDDRAISPAASDFSDVVIPSRDATMSPALEPVPASIRQAVAETPSRSSSRQAMTNLYSPQESTFRSISQQSTTRPLNNRHRHQPSITSILSQISEDGQRDSGNNASVKPALETVSASPEPPSLHSGFDQQQNRPIRPIPKTPIKLDDESHIRRMMAVIQSRSESIPLVTIDRPVMDPLDRLLYGEKLDLNKFHPEVQKMWGNKWREMEEMRMEIDLLIAHVAEQQRRV